VTLEPLGDAAVVVTLGTELSEEVNDRVMSLAAALAADPISPHILDVVPAIASLVVHFDARHVRMQDVMDFVDRKTYPAYFSASTESLHEIPVSYGGDDGPDLDDVAAFAGIDSAEVIRRHAAVTYRVYMLGFVPGFAYLGQVDPLIAAPRRSTPRQQVPAGSVGIAGPQTGVYPQDSPGGWQIIGRTSTRMFDMAEGRSLLQPGDRVRFVPEARP
jgi:5-oxoprolinase (ATP-hydrolysing) subunit B